MTGRTAEQRGKAFTRQSCLGMAAVAVLLLAGLVAVQLSAGAIRDHRATGAAIAHTEQQIADATALTSDRSEVESEVAELLRVRQELRSALPFDTDTLEARFLTYCERSDLRFEGASVQTARPRGALDAVTVRLAFAGHHPQVPMLLDAFFTQAEIVPLTGLDIEVINFIDDRVTGTLTCELLRLRPPDAPGGEILRPFLPTAVPAGSTLAGLGDSREALADAQERLQSEYWGLLEYEGLIAARDHHQAEAHQIEALRATRSQSESDIARAYPVLVRALHKSALGKAGFRVEPGGAVEFIGYD